MKIIIISHIIIYSKFTLKSCDLNKYTDLVYGDQGTWIICIRYIQNGVKNVESTKKQLSKIVNCFPQQSESLMQQ